MAKTLFRKFGRDENGGATIEAVLWLPLMLSFFVMLLDAAMIFTNHSRAVRIVQDANRAYAVGAFTDCTAAASWVQDRVRTIAPTATAACDRSAGVSTLDVSMPSRELDLSGATGVFGGLTVVARSQHFIEIGS